MDIDGARRFSAPLQHGHVDPRHDGETRLQALHAKKRSLSNHAQFATLWLAASLLIPAESALIRWISPRQSFATSLTSRSWLAALAGTAGHTGKFMIERLAKIPV